MGIRAECLEALDGLPIGIWFATVSKGPLELEVLGET